MVFWFLCKCIGRTNYKYYYDSKETPHKETMTDNNFYYGNNPISIGSSMGVQYIANKKNVVEVPNSKTAMRHLFDDTAYKCPSLDTVDSNDQKPSTMQLAKTSSREKFVSKRPRSLTSTRGKNNVDRTDFIAMAPY
jgi:hypothetical protein